MIVSLVVCALLAAETEEKPSAPEPITAYHLTNYEGWDVYVNKRLLREEKELGDQATRLLRDKLREICRLVPKRPLTELQKTPIWLEVDDDKFDPCACYHPSADWLRENGFLDKKEKSVEISNAQKFIDWSKEQPFMLLHELAHSYHDRVFGYDDAAIKAAYQRAQQSGQYEKVLRYNGKEERHYALQNPMEYFAEGTEAYFGTNDYYPFVNAELKKHDPQLHKLLGEIWRDE